jgi:hypothetical protein
MNEYLRFIVLLVMGLVGTYLSSITWEPPVFRHQIVRLLFGLPFLQRARVIKFREWKQTAS